MTIIIRLTLFGFIIAATFFCSLIKAQRQIPSSPLSSASSTNAFFNSFQRPNLQLIQLHAAQQQQRLPPPPPPASPALLNQRRIFRTQQQQQSFVTRRPVPRISLRRRNLSSERSLRAGISRNKPARIILDPNLSNEISDNRFLPQLRTQGNADFPRIAATTLSPQRFSPPRQQQPPPPQRPPPIEVTPSRIPVRPPVLRRPPPPSLASTQSQSLPQRAPQPQQRQQIPQRPPGQSSQRPPPQQQPPPRAPIQQQQQQLPQRPRMQQQQQPQQQRAITQQQQQSFLRPPPSPASSITPRMPQQPPPQLQQSFQNRPPPAVALSMQRPPAPRPQARPQPALSPPPPQPQTFNQPRPPSSPPIQQQQSRSPASPQIPLQQQQMRRRITPEQRFTRPDQARVLPSPTSTAPVGPPRPQQPLFTTNNIDDPNILPPSQISRIRPPSSAHMPGFLPPSNSVVDELNNSKNFLEVARKLHLRRVTRGSAH